MDGWVLAHAYERVEFLDQETIDKFLPEFQPHETALNLHPLLVGAASSREKKLLASDLDSYRHMIAAGSRAHSL